MTGCLVEEELPPLLPDCCKNFASTPTWQTQKIKWGEFWNEEERHNSPKAPMQQALDNHTSPRLCRLTEEHLALIFEMRRDLAEQMHNQSLLSKHMDLLFDSLSGSPQRVAARHASSLMPSRSARKKAQVCLMFRFSTVNFLVLAVLFFAAMKLWCTSWSMNYVDRMFWFPCIWQNMWQAITIFRHVSLSSLCTVPPVLVSTHVAEHVASLDVIF
jgi:hypothetical protein